MTFCSSWVFALIFIFKNIVLKCHLSWLMHFLVLPWILCPRWVPHLPYSSLSPELGLRDHHFPWHHPWHRHHPTLQIEWIPFNCSREAGRIPAFTELGRRYHWPKGMSIEAARNKITKDPYGAYLKFRSFSSTNATQIIMSFVNLQSMEIVVLSILYSIIV